MASDHEDAEQVTPGEPENDHVNGQHVDESEPDSDQAGDKTRDRRSQNLVYIALGAGGVVLAVLLLIVWLSSRDDEGGEVPLCLDISPQNAQTAILDGNVAEVDVLLDQREPLNGLTAVQLRMTDGDCRRLPEGADNRDGLFQILGVVSLYNTAGEQRIEVRYQRQDVPAALLSTSTPEPTATTERSPTPEPTATSERTQTATAEPTATSIGSPTPLPSPEASPVPVQASPVASPAGGSPVASPIAASPSPATPSPDR